MPTYKIPLTVMVECAENRIDTFVEYILEDIRMYSSVVNIHIGIIEEEH